ncbi:MAG: hypothetical protein JJ992_07825, partial [Planctomycetes bacterium]|nr:hypothetical protein [Planctomycetota bacterium]
VLDALPDLTPEQIERLWNALADNSKSAGILNAAAALATCSPQSSNWNTYAPTICNQLIGRDSQTATAWAQFFEPVKQYLIPELRKSYRNSDPELAARRALATDLLSRYASDEPEVLVDLSASADARQFEILKPVLIERGEGTDRPLVSRSP